MKNKLITQQSIALFIAATISGITLNTWWNANAQTTPAKTTPPKYTKLQDVRNFSIKGNGKAFEPPSQLSVSLTSSVLIKISI